jgi:asparaginyl-tRNA synthetase
MQSVREFLCKKEFIEVRAPVIEPYSDPGIRGAEFFSIDISGKQHVIMSAFTLHKHIISSYLGKIFSFAPCLRYEQEESAKTGRHLIEFYQIEVESKDSSYKDAMKYAEELIAYVIKSVKEKYPEELAILERKLIIPAVPFKKIPHSEALKMAKELGFDIKDKELPWEAEKAISLQFSEPFFITDYPKGSRGFYDKDGITTLLDFDMMYPEGFGEASSGGQREDDYEKALEKLKKIDDPKKYSCYLKELKKSPCKTAGFGIGLERLTRFICGLPHIEQACLFPKVPGVKD